MKGKEDMQRTQNMIAQLGTAKFAHFALIDVAVFTSAGGAVHSCALQHLVACSSAFVGRACYCHLESA